jgi:hypothetical protein
MCALAGGVKGEGAGGGGPGGGFAAGGRGPKLGSEAAAGIEAFLSSKRQMVRQ